VSVVDDMSLTPSVLACLLLACLAPTLMTCSALDWFVCRIEAMPIGQGEKVLAAAIKEFYALGEKKDFVRKCGICGKQDIKQSEAAEHSTCWRQVPTAAEVRKPTVDTARKRKRSQDEAEDADDAISAKDSDATMEAEAEAERAQEDDTEALVSSDEETSRRDVGTKRGIMACYCGLPSKDQVLLPACLECHKLSHWKCYPHISEYQSRHFVCYRCETDEF
jgi:hypothetical protein